MRVVAVCVALPRPIGHGLSTVSTGIFKHPVNGPVRVRAEQLEGDGQADRVHHGGPDKAVYAYGLEHYAWWEQTLGCAPLPPGQFGENLTVSGLDESVLCVGDQLAIGSARFVITQPRVPCFKLGLRFGDPSMPQRFARSLRCGVYLRVLEEGDISAGDTVDVAQSAGVRINIRALFAAYLTPNERDSQDVLAAALAAPGLSAEWRAQITERLARRGHPSAD